MNSVLYSELRWLVGCKGFRDECRRIGEGEGAVGTELRRLAGHALTATQLQRLAALLDDLRARGRSTAPLAPLKVGLIGVGTLTLVGPVLRGTGARHGLLIDCVAADYGQIEQEALDPASTIHRAGCDVVLVAFDYRGLPLGGPAINEDDAANRVESSIAMLRTICRGIRANGSARMVLQTVAPPAESLFGSLDASLAGSVQTMVAAFNKAIAAECENASTFLLDTAHLAATVGLAEWHDPAQWNIAKFPFSAELLPLYADHVCRLLGAMQGKARRVLIIDLDNTLWGGVIGDDGLNGIVLGEGEATGEAFLHVQRLALSLRSRGVVLAVCSKNTDEIARTPFRDHPDMILREDHIASFKANWQDKASNIRAIADELALGLDAFVFLDDNPAERELVRHYSSRGGGARASRGSGLLRADARGGRLLRGGVLLAGGSRAGDYYQANSARTAIMAAAGNIDDFLSSLEMRATLQPFDAVGARASIS